jgi:hypothetical protein
MGAPVETWAEIVHQPLPREFLPNTAGKRLCLLQIRCLSLKPDQIRVRRKRQRSGNRSINPTSRVVVSFAGARRCAYSRRDKYCVSKG